MSFKTVVTDHFAREFKKLAKKHRSLKTDLLEFTAQIEASPMTGTSLGNNCYKNRLAITSKGKGKSGGARIITHIYVEGELIYLISIFDKSEKENISEKELLSLLKNISS